MRSVCRHIDPSFGDCALVCTLSRGIKSKSLLTKLVKKPQKGIFSLLSALRADNPVVLLCDGPKLTKM